MQAGWHSPTRAEAAAFAAEVAELWDRELGSQLAGFYLIGSLAHGGFSPRYSDIDVALIADFPLQTNAIDSVRRQTAARAEALAGRLSLFWADRDFSAGRFPPLDRIDLIDHAVQVIERRRFLPARPTLSEIRAHLCGEPLRKWSGQVDRFAAMDSLPADQRKSYLRALLYPARYVYSWETGRIASNDAGVEFLESHAPASSGIDLIRRALQCRNDGQDPDALFAERGKLLKLRALCGKLTKVSAAEGSGVI